MAFEQIFDQKFRPNLNFWGYQICKQTVHEITKLHLLFRLKLVREGRNSEFWQAVSSEISEELSTKKNKLKTAFNNGFYSKWKGLRVVW